MKKQLNRTGVLVCGISALAIGIAGAQSIGPEVIPSPQVIPVYPELGVGVIVPPPQPAPAPLPSPSGQGGGGSGGVTQGDQPAMVGYEASGYATSGIAAANQYGLNPEMLAGFGLAESNFTNVPAANGSTSAYGVYQITMPTWQMMVQKYNLPFTNADITNPADQAVVAAAIAQSYGQTVATAINGPPTVGQVYGAYVFGASPGAAMANAPLDTPLSNIVSAQSLANNNMQGWTVGEFYSNMANRLGGTANDPAFA